MATNISHWLKYTLGGSNFTSRKKCIFDPLLDFPILHLNSLTLYYMYCAIFTAKTRSDRDFEMSLCYTPKAFSCLEEIKYNINHCLELAPSFPKMYNITMF